MSDMSGIDEHGGVTDEDIEKFFRDNPGIRPINPLNGADPNQPVAFHSGDGRPVPPTEGGDVDIPEDVGIRLPSSSESSTTSQATDAGDGQVAPASSPVPGSGDQGDTPPATAASSASPDGFVMVGDQAIPSSQVEAWLAFQQEINADPILQRMIVDRLTGRLTEAPVAGAPAAQQGGSPAPSAPAAPADPFAAIADNLDLDDPSVRALYDVVNQQQRQLSALTMGLQQTHEQTAAQQRASSDALYNRAAESFRVSHDLEKADVQRLSEVAARLSVLPQLMQGIDPITGAPSRPDVLSAVERSLEIAYMMVPEYRQRELARTATQHRDDSQRKKALAAVAGSSGSVARTTPNVPQDANQRRAAMVGEVAKMLEGSWADAPH